MKIGIIGLPQSGKKTLFRLLTGLTFAGAGDTGASLMGMAVIRDSRFDELVKMYKPQKATPGKICFVVLPKLEQETIKDPETFRQIVDVDAVCLVLRAFEDESIYHVDGSVDALRDLNKVNAELLLHDLVFVETRVERLGNNIKKTNALKDQKELALMLRFKECLEANKPLRVLSIDDEDRRLIPGYPLITLKPLVVVLNGDQANAGATDVAGKCVVLCEQDQADVLGISAKIEAEIAELDTDEERRVFFEELGITVPALERLTRLCLHKLGLISFFTVGADEVRPWHLKKGALAPQAAGVIHSDLERGFIRAELMKYDELMTHGSEASLKAAGKFYLKGKDYEVCDGDIMNVLFNV